MTSTLRRMSQKTSSSSSTSLVQGETMKISQLLADVPCGCPLSAQYVWLIAFRGMHRNVQLRAVSECEGGFFLRGCIGGRMCGFAAAPQGRSPLFHSNPVWRQHSCVCSEEMDKEVAPDTSCGRHAIHILLSQRPSCLILVPFSEKLQRFVYMYSILPRQGVSGRSCV